MNDIDICKIEVCWGDIERCGCNSLLCLSRKEASVQTGNVIVYSKTFDFDTFDIKLEETIRKTSLFRKERIVRGALVFSEGQCSPWFTMSFCSAVSALRWLSEARCQKRENEILDRDKQVIEATERISFLQVENSQLQTTIETLQKQIEKLTLQHKSRETRIAFDSVIHDISKFSDNTTVCNSSKTQCSQTTEDGIVLSEEQMGAIYRMENSMDNLFITGKAGTGKSIVLRHFVNTTKKNVAVLAPTGIAAINVKGVTIHSFFGLDTTVLDVKEITASPQQKEKLKTVSTIIIDEISMVRVDVFDAIDVILRQTHNNHLPFGGCQMIVFGDLYQLPPVVGREASVRSFLLSRYSSIFFFGAPSYQQNPFATINLTQVYRQTNPLFIELLNRIRVGDVDTTVLRELNRRCMPIPNKEKILYLTEKNENADKINKERMTQLPGQEFTYRAVITGDFGKASQYPTDEFLNLKVGAQVMMLRNDPNKQWFNGTVGVVAALTSESIKVTIMNNTYSVDRETWTKYDYEFNEDQQKLIKKEVGQFNQFPVRLAYAITIHKSQGKTYDSIILKYDSKAFAAGQTYVALSRCKTYEGLYLEKPLTLEDIKVNREVADFMSSF